MDVLRKELNAFYESQNLGAECLDYSILAECRRMVGISALVGDGCCVITDAAADRCFISAGHFMCVIGLAESDTCEMETDSSDEDEIYNRIHPEDLVDKRMLEYEFFKFVDSRPDACKTDYRAVCRLRIKDRTGRYIRVLNSTRVLRLSPSGKVWLILCTYELCPFSSLYAGIDPGIMNCADGGSVEVRLSEKRARILTDREKQILCLIREGKLSKQIAGELGISVHTVNRHRQNILEKLSVGNSVEAVAAASLMRLL